MEPLLPRVARFFLVKHTKTENIYTKSKLTLKMTKKYSNSRKIGQMSIKYNQHLPLQYPPKFIQIGICGLKIYHLATLLPP
jgi:hypothetical protein